MSSIVDSFLLRLFAAERLLCWRVDKCKSIAPESPQKSEREKLAAKMRKSRKNGDTGAQVPATSRIPSVGFAPFAPLRGREAFPHLYTYEPCDDVDPVPDYKNVLTD